MSSGAALGVLTVLACLSAVSAATAQQDRAQARTPQFVHPEEGVAAPTGMRMMEIDDAIGTRPLRRTAVTGVTAAGPRPPGVTALPRPGEAVVSPALAALIRTDPRAGERFPQRIVGTIGGAGLVAPDELWAYVGVPLDDPILKAYAPSVLGFGGPLRAGLGSQMASPDVFTPARGAAVAFALFALVPLGVFLATCTRLSASTRDRRIAALRLLGVSARQAALVNAVETGVVSAGGALLGAVGYAVLAPVSQGWRIGRLHWFAADLAVPATWFVGVLLAAIGYAVTVGVLATRAARVTPLAVRRGAPARRPGRWRTLPLVAGLGAAALAGADPLALDLSTRGVLFTIAMVVTGLALPTALPVLGYALASLAGRLGCTPVWLELAAARIRHTPGVAPRLVASLAVSIYVVGVGSIGAAVLTNDSGLQTATGTNERLTYQTSGLDRGLLAALREVPGVQTLAVAHLDVTIRGEPGYALVADCAEINRMFVTAAGQSCTDGAAYRLEQGLTGQPNMPAADSEAVGKDGLRIPVIRQTLHLSPRHGPHTGKSGSLLLTRQSPLLGGRDPAVADMTVIADDREAAERAARVTAARTPANLLSGNYPAHQGFDTNLMITILVVGLTVSLVLSIGSFAAAAIDRTVERRRDNAALAVVGTSPQIVAASEVGFGGLPLAIGLATAGLATVVVTASLAGLLGVDVQVVLDRIGPTLWLAAGTLTVGLALIAVPAWVSQRITAEHLRQP